MCFVTEGNYKTGGVAQVDEHSPTNQAQDPEFKSPVSTKKKKKRKSPLIISPRDLRIDYILYLHETQVRENLSNSPINSLQDTKPKIS
jgi:hypothetical protein